MVVRFWFVSPVFWSKFWLFFGGGAKRLCLAWFCVFCSIARQHLSGGLTCRLDEEKRYSGIPVCKKEWQLKICISPQKTLGGWICTKFCTSGRFDDLITGDGNWLTGFDSMKGRNAFSYLQPVAVNTVLALTRSPWLEEVSIAMHCNLSRLMSYQSYSAFITWPIIRTNRRTERSIA